MEEIYILTKHGRFDSKYVEKLPVYKRRYHLHLLKEEINQVKNENNKQTVKTNIVKSRRR